MDQGRAGLGEGTGCLAIDPLLIEVGESNQGRQAEGRFAGHSGQNSDLLLWSL